MRAGKAYISSLGTTGLLIASSFLMLAVVGALVAFDRWPDHAGGEPPVVPIDERPERTLAERRAGPAAALATRGRAFATAERTAAASLRDAAARAGRIQVAADTDSLGNTPVADPVVSALPAPEAAPEAPPPAPAPPPRSAAPAPEPPDPAPAPVDPEPSLPDAGDVVDPPPPGDGGLTEATNEVADSVATVSPLLGTTVRDTGTRVDSTVGALLETASR